MSDQQVLDFQSALAKADTIGGKKHLLLGNGFSIDWKNDVFRYGSLFDRADFSNLSVDHKKLFSSLGTTDFENVMMALKSASILADVYRTTDTELSKKMAEDAELLKDILVQTIADNHPNMPSDISDSEYKFCMRFLNNFSQSKGKIFTLNYDLLLYWVFMHSMSPIQMTCDDGFRSAEENEDFIEWNSYNSQNIYYLHGALHLFDHGYTLEKYTWLNTGVKLMDQIRSALDTNKFPLIVTEGDSMQKMSKIAHSGYLHKGIRSLEAITGNLFIHGHSLADSDDHIFDLLPSAKIKTLFISLHNPSNLDKHKEKFAKIQRIQELRKSHVSKAKNHKSKYLDVYYYDASTARVWR